MKKLILSLMVLGFSCNVFAYQEVESFLRGYTPKYLGDVIDNGGYIVGKAECEDGKYVLRLNTINSDGKRNVIVKVYDDSNTNLSCGIELTHTRDKDPGNLKWSQSCLYYNYNFLKADGSYGAIQNRRICYAPRNPLSDPEYIKDKPEHLKEVAEKAAYFQELMDKWNKDHNYIDALWDTSGSSQYTISQAAYIEAVNGASALGPIIDEELNLYGVVDISWSNWKLYEIKAGNTAPVRIKAGSDFAAARDVRIWALQNNAKVAYKYECLRPNSGFSDQEARIGHVTRTTIDGSGNQYFDGMYPTLNDKGTYECQEELDGIEITLDEYVALFNLGMAKLIPVLIK